jgi:hypothetical protein
LVTKGQAVGIVIGIAVVGGLGYLLVRRASAAGGGGGGGGGCPPRTNLTFQISPLSGGVGTTVQWQSSGWCPGESVGIIIFDPYNNHYYSDSSLGPGRHTNADSSGNASGSFVISSQDFSSTPAGTVLQVYAEDATTPFPHTGYQTHRINFTLT